MKLRLSILLLSLLAVISSWGQNVQLVSQSPADGETVSTLDATLVFDIEEAAINQNLVDNCCIYGRLTFTYYRGEYGTEEAEKLASKVITYNGKTEGATYSKLQEFFAAAPSDIQVIVGEKYSITVSGTVSISKYNSAAYITSTTISTKYSANDPIVISCIGGKPDPSSFYFVESSLTDAEPQAIMPEVTVTFSQPVSIVGTDMPSIKKSTAVTAVAKDAKVKPDDPCSIVISFEAENLWIGSYTVEIPKGFVCQADKPERINNQLELSLTGAYYECFYPKTTKPEINGTGIEETYLIEFDLASDQKLPVSAVKAELYLYENEVSEENLCETFAVELRSSSFFPHQIEIPITYPYKPETKYIFVFPEGVYTLQSKYKNARVEIAFTTPTPQTSGLATMQFKAANGIYNEQSTPAELVNDMELDRLGDIDLVLKSYHYQDWELTFNPAENSDYTVARLFDVTSGERKEVKSATVSRVKRETKVDIFYALTMNFDTELYADHEYELVIPIKATGVSSIVYNNFIPKADEFTLKLKGATSVGDPIPTACSLNENQELDALHTVHWTFPAGFIVAGEEAKAAVEFSDSRKNEAWLSMASDEEGSYLTAVFSDRKNGEPVSLAAGESATVVLPANSVVFAGLPDEVGNEEIRIPVSGKQPVAPETVNVEVSSAGQLYSLINAMKGKPFTLKLTPDENWSVSSLACNGTDVTDKVANGVYSVESLDEDSSFDVEMAYSGDIIFMDESGIAEIAAYGTKVSVRNKTILIEGVKAGDRIEVYTVGGMKVADHQATDDVVRITLSGGAVYIVRINDNAVKVQL